MALTEITVLQVQPPYSLIAPPGPPPQSIPEAMSQWLPQKVRHESILSNLRALKAAVELFTGHTLGFWRIIPTTLYDANPMSQIGNRGPRPLVPLVVPQHPILTPQRLILICGWPSMEHVHEWTSASENEEMWTTLQQQFEVESRSFVDAPDCGTLLKGLLEAKEPGHLAVEIYHADEEMMGWYSSSHRETAHPVESSHAMPVTDKSTGSRIGRVIGSVGDGPDAVVVKGVPIPQSLPEVQHEPMYRRVQPPKTEKSLNEVWNERLETWVLEDLGEIQAAYLGRRLDVE